VNKFALIVTYYEYRYHTGKGHVNVSSNFRKQEQMLGTTSEKYCEINQGLDCLLTNLRQTFRYFMVNHLAI
jgi:hypothetical protein